MKHELSHFAIYIDDIERAKNFYENLFGWAFNGYGAGDFLQVKASKEDDRPIGALQSRQYAPLEQKVIGFECTVGVEDIDVTIEKVSNLGGKVLMPKTAIPYVGWISKFLDTEGNLFCAMQYDNQAR